MKKSIIAFALTAALATTGAQAKDKQQSQNELIGFGSGALAGALIAGPVGAVVAGIFGLMIADDVNDEAKLTAAQQDAQNNAQALLVLQQQREQERTLAGEKLANLARQLEQRTLSGERQIQFRTGSAELEAHYQPQLAQLAQQLKSNPLLTVDLAGFADRRGDEAYNRNLSQERVAKVEQYLIDQGVKQEQIVSNYYGEASPVAQQQSHEGDFFDRRVQITLGAANSRFAASSQP